MNKQLRMTLDKQLSEYAPVEYVKGIDIGSSARYGYYHGYNAAIQAVLELIGEFSELESYYRLGYDSELEPGVKYIIQGAKGEHAEILRKIKGDEG